MNRRDPAGAGGAIKSITNRESQSLDKYLQEIGKEGLITADMEVELARKIKEGDGRALE